MRCFSTVEGQVLVEWEGSSTDVLKPDRTPLGRSWSFYLLDAANNVARTWSSTSVSVQEHLSRIAHVVEADELVAYFHDVRWEHEDQPTLERFVELDGLRPLPAAEAPSKQAIRAAIDRHEAAKREAWGRARAS